MADLRDRLYRALRYPTSRTVAASRNRTTSSSSNSSYRRSSSSASTAYSPPQAVSPPQQPYFQPTPPAAQRFHHQSPPPSSNYGFNPSVTPSAPVNQFVPHEPSPPAPPPVGPPPTMGAPQSKNNFKLYYCSIKINQFLLFQNSAVLMHQTVTWRMLNRRVFSILVPLRVKCRPQCLQWVQWNRKEVLLWQKD